MARGQVLSKWTNFDWLQANDGSSVSVAPTGKGRLRYNNSTQKFEASTNGGAYAPLIGTGATNQVAVYQGTSSVSGSANMTLDGNGRLNLAGDLGLIRTDGGFGVNDGVGLKALGTRHVIAQTSTNDGSSSFLVLNAAGGAVHNFASNGNAFISGVAEATRFSAGIGQSGGYAYLCNNTTTMNTFETSGAQVVWCYPRYLDNALYLDGGSGGTYIRANNGSFTGLSLHPAGYATIGGGLQTTYRCQVVGSANGSWSFQVTNGANFYACHAAGYGMHCNSGSSDNSGLYIAQFYNGVGHAMTIRGDRVIEIGDATGFEYLNGGQFNINNRRVMAGNCPNFTIFSSAPNFFTVYAAGDAYAGTAAQRIVTDSNNGNGVMRYLECWNDINGNEGGPHRTIYLQSDGGIVGIYKTFEIKHPIPALNATKILRHVSIEAPRADLIYRGKSKLSDGKVVVNVDTTNKMTDGTFVLLCKNAQVFVCCNESFLRVTGWLDGNQLTITSECPTNANVDWMIVAERCDKNMMDTERTDDTGSIIVEQDAKDFHPETPVMPKHGL